MDVVADASTVLAPRVVIADDDDLALMLLQDGLKGMGFQPTGCTNGKDAILLALRLTPEAVLLDDKMPGLDAMKAVKMIRIMEPIRAIPVLLMAEQPDKSTIVRAIQMGASDCLSKEGSLHDINLRIQRLIKAPVRKLNPIYEHFRYFFHFDGSTLMLDIDSEITNETGKSMIEVVRAVTGLMPLKVALNLEKAPAIAASGIGYLSDVKDTVTECGGTIMLCQTDFSRFPANVQRFLEKYFQVENQAASGKPISTSGKGG